jgi:hypothetical protein
MKSGNLVIDAQAIEHLELLEIPGRSRLNKEGSFFNFISSANGYSRFCENNFMRFNFF